MLLMATPVYADPVPAPPRPLPWDLRLVAYLYLAGGIAAIVHMVVAAIAGRPLLNAAVVFLIVGLGLLRLRRAWRRRAIVITVALPLLGLAMTGYLYVLNGRNFVKWVGFSQGTVAGIAACAVLLALVVWMLRVLSSARTRALFGDS
jgi:hypothetical protein